MSVPSRRIPLSDPLRTTATPILTAVLATVLSLVVAPAPAPAQSDAREVAGEAIEQWEERMSGIDDYTVVQYQEGRQDTTTTYFERVGGFGTLYYRAHTVGEEAPEERDDPYQLLEEVGRRGEYLRSEDVRGEETHVVRVGGVSPEEYSPAGPLAQSELAVTYWLDDEDYLIRRLVIEGQAQAPGRMRGMRGERQGMQQQAQAAADSTRIVLDFMDYREVDGLLHPHRIEIGRAHV